MAVSQSDFDAMVKAEIRKQGVRSSRTGDSYNQDARDAVARRLNAQEGRSRNSTAYKPGPNKAPSASRQGKQSGGTRGAVRRPAGGRRSTPTPTARPDVLPDTTTAIPTPRPGEAPDLSLRNLLIPLLMAGALGGTAGYRYLTRGKAGGLGEEAGVPTRTVPTNDMPVVLGSGRVTRAPLPINVDQDVSRPLPFTTDPSVQMRAGEGNVGRLITPEMLADVPTIAPKDFSTGGDVTPRMRGTQDMNLPPVGSATPGWHSPILKHIVR